MQFFTPQLYLDFNSPNDELADRAEAAWEKAIQKYHKHVNRIRALNPDNVAKLCDLDLHDAVILTRPQGGTKLLAPFSWGLSCITVLKGHDVLALFYFLTDSVRVHAAPKGWPFSRENEHWLYDEIDAAGKRGALTHRILLSSGIELEIPFTRIDIHRLPAPASANRGKKKQTA